MPRTSSGIDFLASFGGYTFTGELGGCEVYENLPENTMATVYFSIMQTELPPDSDFMIGSVTVSRLNARTDEGVTKTEFRNLLEAITEATGISFRLPTSEEWVYAAQGGNRSSGYTYSGSNDISEVAWYGSNSGGRIHEIATKAPNELGLYDMSGNYGEVCNDVDDAAYIDGAIRGGSWRDSSSECKCTSSESGRTSGNIPGTNIKEKNAFDARYNTVRLVYSRDWQ